MSTNQKDKTMPIAEMVRELKEAGAEIAKREDRNGDTKSGWWLDGVYLAQVSRPQDALRAIKGN